VVDIGCNAGFYSFEMKLRGAARVVGIDSDTLYTAQARFAADVLGLDMDIRDMGVFDVARLAERFDSYDNALAETINALFRAGAIHRRGPRRNSEAVEYATLTWGDWFNTRRLLEPIGNIPPAQAAANYYAANEQLAMAA